MDYTTTSTYQWAEIGVTNYVHYNHYGATLAVKYNPYWLCNLGTVCPAGQLYPKWRVYDDINKRHDNIEGLHGVPADSQIM